MNSTELGHHILVTYKESYIRLLSGNAIRRRVPSDTGIYSLRRLDYFIVEHYSWGLYPLADATGQMHTDTHNRKNKEVYLRAW